MLKKLIKSGGPFLAGFFAAIGLWACLPAAQGAPTPQNCDCPCAKDKKKAALAEGPTGQITIMLPRPDSVLARAFHSKIQVRIDDAAVGAVDFDAPLTVSIPNGPHKLQVKDGSGYLENIASGSETPITISAQKPLYFQIVNNGLHATVSELDAATAQTLIPASHAEASTLSGPATIYFYWPKMGLDFGLLDKYGEDSKVYLDGKPLGAFKNGEYMQVKVPGGEHVLFVDMRSTSGESFKKKFIIAAGSTSYFHVQKGLDYHIVEDSPEDAADFAQRGLRQREASAQ